MSIPGEKPDAGQRIPALGSDGAGSVPDAEEITLTSEQRRAFRAQKVQERQQVKAQREDRHPRFTHAMRLALMWLRSGPASVTIAALMVVVFFAAIPLGHAGIQPVVTAGLGRPWWTLLTSMLWTTDGLHVLVDVVLLLSVGVGLERTLRTRWYLGVGLVSYWLGSAMAVLVAMGIDAADPTWGTQLKSQNIAGISVFLVGVAMATSVKMDSLWRRRIQISAGTVLLIMLGFAGTLDTVAAFCAALVGLGLGYLFWRDQRDTKRIPGTRREGRVLVSLIVAGVVVGVLISLSSPQAVGALTSLRYQFVSNDLSAQAIADMCGLEGLEGQCAHYTFLLRSAGWGSKILVVMPLLLQLVLAWGLRGGRRAAMWGTIGLQGLTALIALAHMVTVWTIVRQWNEAAALLGFSESGAPTGRFIVPIVVPLVLILVVALPSRMFTVRAAVGTYRKFWLQLASLTAIVLLISVVLGAIFRGSLSVLGAVGLMISDFFIRMLPSSMLSLVSPQAVMENYAMMVILEWAPTIPWIGACILLLRSFAQRSLPNAISRDQYIQTVKATDAGTLGWIATWEGNLYWGSTTYEAAIAYRAHGGVALSVSDPAAKPEDLMAVIKEFTDFCVDQDLTPAFYSVHAPVAAATEKWGWPRLQVAEETLLLLPDLAFKGRAFQDIRTSMNRAAKEGIREEWTTWADMPADQRKQVRDISAQWVSDKSLPEMGFTLGGIAELDDSEVRILLAVDEDNWIHGVTSWMPVYDRGDVIGWTLDFMRRRDGGFRPVMEFLIAKAALWAHNEQCEVLSLSGVPLAKAGTDFEKSTFEGTSLTSLDALLKLLGNALEPVYGFRSLMHFKSKFRPKYVPMYLTLPDVAGLPAVGLAISHAYLPTLTLTDAVHVVAAMNQK